MDWLNHLLDLIFKDPTLILAFAVGAVSGWLIALRQNEAFRRLAKDIQEAYQTKINFLTNERKEREALQTSLETKIKEVNLEHASILAGMQQSSEAPDGNARPTKTEEPGGPAPHPKRTTYVNNMNWEQVSQKLLQSGVSGGSIEGLKEALLNRELGLHDSDGRLRVRLWSRGLDPTPVAILWRGRQNHRVLFPDGTDDIVKVGELTEVGTSASQA